MIGMDPLFAIYRSRADRLLVELWAVHIAAGALIGAGLVIFSPLGWWALPVAIAAGCGAAACELAAGERRLASALCPQGSSSMSASDVPRLENLVEGVCLLAGVEPPRLVICDSAAANVAAFGRRPNRTTIVLTSGLLSALDRIELEAVVARLLTQIRDGRISYMTTAVTTVGLPGLFSDSLFRVARARLEREAGTGSDFEADADAVRLTRYPPGLASALGSMSRVGVDVAAPPATWPLWLADPRAASETAPDELPDYRADLDTRVAVLREF